MTDSALIWAFGLWPLLLGTAIAAWFRARFTKLRNALLVVVVIYGLQGICHLPYEAARLFLLADHSPNWLSSNEIMAYGYFSGDVLAALLSVIFSRRIALWAGAAAHGA
jgi:hypothetical protein